MDLLSWKMLSFCTLFKNFYYCSVAAPIVNWFFPHISSRKYICDSWLSLSCISRKGPNLVLGRPTYQDFNKAVEMAHWLRALTVLQDTWIWLPAPTMDDSQPPVSSTPDSLPLPFEGPWIHVHTPIADTHIHIIKKYIIEKMTSFSSIECFWSH